MALRLEKDLWFGCQGGCSLLQSGGKSLIPVQQKAPIFPQGTNHVEAVTFLKQT